MFRNMASSILLVLCISVAAREATATTVRNTPRKAALPDVEESGPTYVYKIDMLSAEQKEPSVRSSRQKRSNRPPEILPCVAKEFPKFFFKVYLRDTLLDPPLMISVEPKFGVNADAAINSTSFQIRDYWGNTRPYIPASYIKGSELVAVDLAAADMGTSSLMDILVFDGKNVATIKISDCTGRLRKVRALVPLKPTTSSYNIKSGNVLMFYKEKIIIKKFYYNGEAPDLHFFGGRGSLSNKKGVLIPTERNGLTSLKAYNGQDVVLKLPEDVVMSKLDYIGLYCVKHHSILAYSPISKAIQKDFTHYKIKREQLANKSN